MVYNEITNAAPRSFTTPHHIHDRTSVKNTILKSLAVAASAIGLTAGIAGPAVAQEEPTLPGTVTVANGTQFLIRTHYVPEIDGDNQENWRNAFCTIGAVGNDKYGNDVAVTAGHCWGSDIGIYDAQPIPAGTTPVWDKNNLDWKEGGDAGTGYDPIGYLRWAKDTDGSAVGSNNRDYAIIELAEGVQMSSMGSHIRQTGIHELPNGQIDSPNVVNFPSKPNERILGTGIFTNHQLITSGQTGVWYGRITSNSFYGLGTYQSHAQHIAGDSGGPAVIKDAEAQYPSASNGYTTAGKWVGITRGLGIGIPPYMYTSSANIMADLRARDEASNFDGSVVGAGLTLTTNP